MGWEIVKETFLTNACKNSSSEWFANICKASESKSGYSSVVSSVDCLIDVVLMEKSASH